jgi:glycosyltransferase involved in cell wall biosynthesis
VTFRPKIIYYTASPQGFAFYRDLVITIPIKLYCSIIKTNTYYHYHARGIRAFTRQSNLKRKLTNFFIKNTCLIFISKQLEDEVEYLNGYKGLFFLPNGVDDNIGKNEFVRIVSKRNKNTNVKLLYLSNMIKDKGYDMVLDIAKQFKDNSNHIHVDFAGAWASKEDEMYFNNFLKVNNLEAYVTYHGLVQGTKKKRLFSEATLFIFPSSYKKEVFPLVILEALCYGLPILAFNIGAVNKIIHSKIGILSDKDHIFEDLKHMILEYNSENTFYYCRNEYLNNYTIEVFEKNLLQILKPNNA